MTKKCEHPEKQLRCDDLISFSGTLGTALFATVRHASSFPASLSTSRCAKPPISQAWWCRIEAHSPSLQPHLPLCQPRAHLPSSVMTNAQRLRICTESLRPSHQSSSPPLAGCALFGLCTWSSAQCFIQFDPVYIADWCPYPTGLPSDGVADVGARSEATSLVPK